MTRLKKKYLKKQKLAGLLLFIVALIITLCAEGTIGCAGMMLGLYLVFTKNVIFNRYNYIDELKERQRQMRSR